MKWEYKTIKVEGTLKTLFIGKTLDLEDDFNKLGKEGWELITVIGLAAGGSTQTGLQAIFKRPLE